MNVQHLKLITVFISAGVCALGSGTISLLIAIHMRDGENDYVIFIFFLAKDLLSEARDQSVVEYQVVVPFFILLQDRCRVYYVWCAQHDTKKVHIQMIISTKTKFWKPIIFLYKIG